MLMLSYGQARRVPSKDGYAMYASQLPVYLNIRRYASFKPGKVRSNTHANRSAGTHQQSSRTSRHTDQVLQDTKLGLLNLRPQARNLALYPRIHFLDLEFLLATLVAYPALFEVQV